jgi:hypothetical protein
MIGTYRVRQTVDGQLEFTVIADPCFDRSDVITGQTWQPEALRQ